MLKFHFGMPFVDFYCITSIISKKVISLPPNPVLNFALLPEESLAAVLYVIRQR